MKMKNRYKSSLKWVLSKNSINTKPKNNQGKSYSDRTDKEKERQTEIQTLRIIPSSVNMLFGSFQKNSLNFSQTSIWTRTGNFRKVWHFKITQCEQHFLGIKNFSQTAKYFTLLKTKVILSELRILTGFRFLTLMSDLI